MAINESTRAFLSQAQAMGVKPFHQYSPAEAKALFSNLSASFGPGPEVGQVRDEIAPGTEADIPLRLFLPQGRPRGVMLYCHGGGWVLGNVADYDAFARRLTVATGWAVALVDYRLAPEHTFPAPLEDCWSALLWLADRAPELAGSGRPLAVAGDSAGGNLAAVLARRARDLGAPHLAAQVLTYPVVQAGTIYPSQSDPECQLLLSQADMDWFWDHYDPEKTARASPDGVPLLAEDLSRLPRALVLTAGHDPLRDEGIAYADRLKAAGVTVTHHNYAHDMHGFATLPSLSSNADALRDVADFLCGLKTPETISDVSSTTKN